MLRRVSLAGGIYLLAYAAISIATGQRLVWLGNLAQLVPPLAFAAIALALARRGRRQVRIFWNLNAAHGLIWAAGQAVWTYYDVVRGAVPIISPTDPIFFASSVPLAAALYGRPDRARPRWLFDIVVLDIVLIALFAAFLYMYFVWSILVSGGPDDQYDLQLTQLLNGRNLLLAAWAVYVWRTANAPNRAWQRMLGVYAAGLSMMFLGGLVYDVVEWFGTYEAGALWDVAWMAPYVVLMAAAAIALEERLLQPAEEEPRPARLPVVSLVAVGLLVAIPAVDEVARRTLTVSDATANLRTRLALAVLLPFGIVVVMREYLSRRALLHAAQELTATREQLLENEKLAAVGQLVSGVAHELNNPLQGVIGYAELMIADRRPAESKELQAIRDNANRAAGIVRSLMVFAGKSGSTRGWRQVNEIVREAVLACEPSLQGAAIDLRTELGDRLPLACVDPARFHDVVRNLIRNAEAAIVARRAGGSGPEPDPARAPGEIVISTRWDPSSDRLFISVADNGSGVREEDLPRLFEPFFTTREAGEGAGLGLSVCYGIVREHGGTIQARNLPDGGAQFVIVLPVTAESMSPPAAAEAAARVDPRVASRAPFVVVPPADETEVTPRRRRALVVDDEESNAALVRRVLTAAGYDVESTTLSRQALVMVERSAYDVVIADVKMPELSGRELYSRACQLRPEMARRFIFITGDIDGEDTREFLEQSRCSYLMKPFNLQRLTAAVDMMTGSQPSQTTG